MDQVMNLTWVDLEEEEEEEAIVQHADIIFPIVEKKIEYRGKNADGVVVGVYTKKKDETFLSVSFLEHVGRPKSLGTGLLYNVRTA